METVHLELPQFYSSAHREIATSLLAAIDQTNRPYSSDWTAPWLLTSIKSPDWIVGDDDSWLGDDGVWHEASVYHWAYRLPDGTCLTDDANERMLIAAQRVAFLWRTLPDGLCTTSSVLLGCLYGLSVFIRWLYLHAPVFAPAEHVFQRVDHASLCDFATRFVTGGVPWVLDYPQQVLVRWFDRSLGMKPPRSILNNPFSVSPEYKKAIAGWLMGVGYYRPAVRDGEMYIDRRRLADEMHFELNSIKSHARFSAFLRQFEPTVKSSLLKGRETRREFPSHRTPLLSEASRMGTQAESNYSRMLTGLFQLRTHLPSIIPDTTNFRFGEISRIFQRGNAPTHTPWIPLNIALKLTQEALRWVFVYGSDLVEAYLDTCQKLILQGYFHTGNLWRAGIPRRERFVRGLVFSNSLVPIRIDGWATKTISSNDAPAFAEFRRAPGLNDALAVLVGAVIVLLSFLKPIRVCEIRDLARDCVMYAEGDGYWLSQRAAKKLLAGKRPTDERPIPRIVCVALSLMDRLGEGLRKMTGDCPEALRGRLFYLPDRDVSDALYVGPLTPARERSYLDRFCDWVNLPCDKYGRRWYVRTHECRKSFLITFFWCFRYASLDAARWIAGHRDSRDVYAYIEANFPGMEMPNIESQYASEQLWLHEHGSEVEVDNVEDLYRDVCRHFRVRSISLLEESELNSWLELAFSRKSYQIEPYSVRVDGQIADTRICFRIDTRSDDA